MKDTFLFCKREYDRLEEMLQAAVSRKEWQKAHDLQTEQSAYAAVMEHCFKNEFPCAAKAYCEHGNKTLVLNAETWQPDWSKVKDWADWVAVDENGHVYIYEFEPNKGGIYFGEWHVDEACKSDWLCHLDFGVSHYWHKMIYKRPVKIWQPDWSNIPDWVNWVTVDKDGDVSWRNEKPVIEDCMWIGANTRGIGYKIRYVEIVPKEQMGNWQEMIYERPQDDIDWSKLDRIYKYVAMDRDGRVHAYAAKPYVCKSHWESSFAYDFVFSNAYSDKYKKTPWRDSLRQRPQEK